MKLAKIISANEIDLRFCADLDSCKIERLKEEGFLEFVASHQPPTKIGFIAIDSFNIVNNNIVQSWEVVQDPSFVLSQVGVLKAKLSSTDYKVSKCYEASLLELPLPYDIDSLHAERQTMRGEINRLQELLTQ